MKLKIGILLVLISSIGILFLIVQNQLEHNDNITNTSSVYIRIFNEGSEKNESNKTL